MAGYSDRRKVPRYITTTAIARIHSVSPRTVRNWIRDRGLPATLTQATPHYTDADRVGETRGHWRILLDDYETWVVKWRAGLI